MEVKIRLEKIIKGVKFLVLTNLGPAVSIGNNVYLNDELIFENIDPVSVWYQSGVIWCYTKDNDLSIYSTETKKRVSQNFENFAGVYPFLVEETNNGSLDQYLYVMYDFVLRPSRSFKIAKFNIWKEQVEGDPTFLNGSMVSDHFGKYFIEWPAGRLRNFGVIDTESHISLWQKEVEINKSLNLLTIQDSKIYVQESEKESSSLKIYDLYTGNVIDTKPLIDDYDLSTRPMKYDQARDKFLMPFVEFDRSTLNRAIQIQKYKGFISSKATRYGYSGVDCFNNIFHAMSFYRDHPNDPENPIFELALFERHTYKQIILEDMEGFTNPIRDLQCTHDKLFLRDTSEMLFVYDIQSLAT